MLVEDRRLDCCDCNLLLRPFVDETILTSPVLVPNARVFDPEHLLYNEFSAVAGAPNT